MDQEQAGTAAVPCAGPEEGADGNAVGLPDLQPAVLDPPKQATHNTVREGRRGARLFRGGKSSIQDTHTQFTAIFSNGVSSQLPGGISGGRLVELISGGRSPIHRGAGARYAPRCP